MTYPQESQAQMLAHDALFGVLKRFADTLADRYDVTDVLYGLADHAVEVLGASAAGVSLVDDEGHLQFASANSERATALEMVQQEEQEGPCYQAFVTETEVVVDDISQHAEWPTYRAKAVEVGIASVIGLPMILGDRRLGALNVYSHEPRSWTDGDVDAARVLANMATSYVLHASELDEAKRVNEQLQRALVSRVVIEQAKGLLAGELGISLDDSFELLRSHARRNRATLRSVAQAVVDLGLRPKPPSSNRSIGQG